jgi:two-component system, LytTR family, sensor kinase
VTFQVCFHALFLVSPDPVADLSETSRRTTPSAGRSHDPGPNATVGARGFLLIIGFWTLYGIVTTAGLLLSPLREGPAVPIVVGAVIFSGAYTWAALTLPLFWLTRVFNLEGGHRPTRLAGLALLALAISAAVSIVIALASWFALQHLFGLQLDDPRGVWLFARFRFLTDLLACLLILTAGIARDYFLRFQARQEEASQLRVQLAESRLQFLRAQLNPHFLSNTMNAVSALVTRDPRAVRRMIARLSDLLRYTLEAPSEPEVTLEQELRVLQHYLEILEIRYQGRLKTRVHAEPETLRALVPNLIIQPLAENAMEHGVSQAGGYGAIAIEARRDGEQLVLTVQDTGASGLDRSGMAEIESREPSAESPEDGESSSGGYGLRHARDRLEQLYGREATLHLMPIAGLGMRAEIRLPFHTREALDDSQDLAGVPLGMQHG